MDIFISILLSVSGATLLYLTLPNQGWRCRPMARAWRWLAFILLLASWSAWMLSLDPKAGFFAALIVVMLLLGLWPLLSLLCGKNR